MLDRVLIYLTEGQRIIDLPFGFTTGDDSLIVSINGKVLFKDREYTEVSLNKLELLALAKAGEILEARILRGNDG